MPLSQALPEDLFHALSGALFRAFSQALFSTLFQLSSYLMLKLLLKPRSNSDGIYNPLLHWNL